MNSKTLVFYAGGLYADGNILTRDIPDGAWIYSQSNGWSIWANYEQRFVLEEEAPSELRVLALILT